MPCMTTGLCHFRLCWCFHLLGMASYKQLNCQFQLLSGQRIALRWYPLELGADQTFLNAFEQFASVLTLSDEEENLRNSNILPRFMRSALPMALCISLQRSCTMLVVLPWFYLGKYMWVCACVRACVRVCVSR